jgi:hypothetical protein
VPEDRIGQWCYRDAKAHLVESQIEDRVIIRCGKQLHLYVERRGFLKFSERPPWDHPACLTCTGKTHSPTLNTRGDAP